MPMTPEQKARLWTPETRAYADSVRNRGGDSYTINVPGIQDVVRIPAMESEDLKFQRWLRYKNTRNPAPGYAQAAAKILNYIDDAQDLLFTALALAWPLLRKLPKRFLPGLGWILTVNDILNLMTCLLGEAARPGMTKPECFETLHLLRGGRLNLLARAQNFTKRFPWLAFLFQAPQALQTVTGWILGGPGYGILPGPIMGLISDLFWGGLQSAAGNRVQINAPPPADLGSKSARLLSQPAYHHAAHQAFSLEDHLMLDAALSIATQVVALLPMTEDIPDRAELLRVSQIAEYTPWTESSMTVALSEGWTPDLESRDPVSPDLGTPTYEQIMRQLTLDWYSVELALSREWAGATLGTINSMLIYESGDRIFSWLNGDVPMWDPVFSDAEKTFARQFEHQTFAPADITAPGLAEYLTAAFQRAEARGANAVSQSDLAITLSEFFPA